MCKPTPGKANEASLEDLVRADPALSYAKALRPALAFLGVMMQKVARPRTWLAVYFAFGIAHASYGVVPGSPLLRKAMVVAAGMPVLACCLFVLLALYMMCHSRKTPYPEAQDLLLERIRSGRAERHPNACDVFLPASKKQTKQIGMIFFPGAHVNHTAYAPIAAALSDQGILVVVICLEPIRIVSALDLNHRFAMDAIERVETVHKVSVDEWVLSGHSAGAMTALNLAVEGTAVHSSISRVVVCGVMFNQTKPEGSTATFRNHPKAFEVLVVNATNDGIVKTTSEKARNEFFDYLPPQNTNPKSQDATGKTTSVMIEGGNHSGFGHYGGNSMDGERTIEKEEQQKILIDSTVEFLL